MKVILSRKGFDGSNGGMPSPIMPDGTLLSMPIPGNDIQTYEDLVYSGHSFDEILHDLRPTFSKEHCHVDPDIDTGRHKHVIPGWIPAFGQINAAQGYLANTVGIGEGDLFLFFGNFHFVEEIGGHFKFIHRCPIFHMCHDIQVIWGYLFVDRIVTGPETKRFFWHPHSVSWRRSNPSNTIYVGRANSLFFHEKLMLTMEGASKANWKYNAAYAPENVIGKRRNSSTNGGIYYRGIWQELGLKETLEATRWALSLVSE